MNDRFIRKKIFQIGQFYQIDSFNPVYLDKTGQLIASSEDILEDWNGNLSEFHFKAKDSPFDGKVNMQCFWYRNPNQSDYKDSELPNFCNFIKKTNELIDSVYQPQYYKRVGLRLQYIVKSTPTSAKEKYSHFFDKAFSKLSKYGDFNTTALGFDINQKELSIKINVNIASKRSNNDINVPDSGLLFDLDFFKVFDKFKKDDAFHINENILSFSQENYKELLCSLAEEMGIIDE